MENRIYLFLLKKQTLNYIASLTGPTALTVGYKRTRRQKPVQHRTAWDKPRAPYVTERRLSS